MKVKFLPMDKEFEVTSEESILDVALAHQIPIRTVCKGVPACAECRVRIVEGENNVLPPTKAELNLIGSGYFVDHRRLSCQLHCYGNVTIDLTEQLAKASETSYRKMRGGGRKGSVNAGESRAIQDTYLLKEKVMDTDYSKDSDDSESDKEAQKDNHKDSHKENQKDSHKDS